MEISMRMFMVLVFIIGVLICVYSLKIRPLTTNCTDKVQKSVEGLLVLGTMMLSISGTYVYCGCASHARGTFGGTGMLILLFVLGLVTLSLTSIIRTGCPAAKTDTPTLLVLSILMTSLPLMSLVFSAYRNWQGVSKMKRKAEPSALPSAFRF